MMILQDKQRRTEDSLLTLLGDLDMELEDEDFSYKATEDPDFKQFDALMTGIAGVIDLSLENSQQKKEEKSIFEMKLLTSVAGVMKKRVEELEQESLNTIVRSLSEGLIIARNSIAENNIVIDPTCLDFKITSDVGKIPQSILVNHEDTVVAYTKKNDFLIAKGSFGYQILKSKKGFYNVEEMLCKFLFLEI